MTLPFDSRVWQFCDVAVDRSPAATRCEAVGMFLASIHNDRQTEWVGDVIARLDLGYRVWIGLRENPPRWDDGSGVDYFNFIGGATTGDSMLEQCVNVMGGLLWDDDDCVGNSFPYVCASAP